MDIEKEIKSIKTYIRNKISDIVRTVERQNKAYKSSPDEKDKNMDEEEESKENTEEENNKRDEEEETTKRDEEEENDTRGEKCMIFM